MAGGKIVRVTTMIFMTNNLYIVRNLKPKFLQKSKEKTTKRRAARRTEAKRRKRERGAEIANDPREKID